MQRLSVKRQRVVKKKNVRKSELAKIKESEQNSEMEDAAKKAQFDQLVELVSELQAKWTNPEIHLEVREDLCFELN